MLIHQETLHRLLKDRVLFKLFPLHINHRGAICHAFGKGPEPGLGQDRIHGGEEVGHGEGIPVHGKNIRRIPAEGLDREERIVFERSDRRDGFRVPIEGGEGEENPFAVQGSAADRVETCSIGCAGFREQGDFCMARENGQRLCKRRAQQEPGRGVGRFHAVNDVLPGGILVRELLVNPGPGKIRNGQATNAVRVRRRKWNGRNIHHHRIDLGFIKKTSFVFDELGFPLIQSTNPLQGFWNIHANRVELHHAKVESARANRDVFLWQAVAKKGGIQVGDQVHPGLWCSTKQAFDNIAGAHAVPIAVCGDVIGNG